MAKASEIIKYLVDGIKENGDLPVVITKSGTDDETVDLVGFSTMVGKDDKPVHVLACDQDMMDSFL